MSTLFKHITRRVSPQFKTQFGLTQKFTQQQFPQLTKRNHGFLFQSTRSFQNQTLGNQLFSRGLFRSSTKRLAPKKKKPVKLEQVGEKIDLGNPGVIQWSKGQIRLLQFFGFGIGIFFFGFSNFF